MKEISFDLETLGTKPDCVILSIAATLFDFEEGVGETFYVKLNKDLQFDRVIDEGTKAWWAKQNKEVYEEAVSGTLSLEDALIQLNEWLPKGCFPWGNGSTFDVSILENAYNSLPEVKTPWLFWAVQDMRTIVRVAKLIADFDKNSIEFVGDAHNAKDDAIHQATVMIAAYKSLSR